MASDNIADEKITSHGPSGIGFVNCGTGESLVKGVMITLSAIGPSIKPGGSAREIEIAGGNRTNGAGASPIEKHGAIDSPRVSGGLLAVGGGFDKI